MVVPLSGGPRPRLPIHAPPRPRRGRRTVAALAVLITLSAGLWASPSPVPSATAGGSAGPPPPPLPSAGASAARTAGVAEPASAPPAPPVTNDSVPLWTRGDAAGSLGDIGPRTDAAAASDPASGTILFFGGYVNDTLSCLLTVCALGDTWVSSAGHLTNVTPDPVTATNSPSPRWGAALVWDPALGAFVLFGGTASLPDGVNDPALNDTWLFSPSTGRWTAACTSCVTGLSSPPARWDAGAAYDPALAEVVIFGGETTVVTVPTALSDTWAFNGSAWTPLNSTAGPSARSSPAMAWDAATGSILLYGGAPANSQTWSWNSSGWTRLEPISDPGDLAGASLATSPVNGSVVLVGGCASDPCAGRPSNLTWSFSGGEWVELAPYRGIGPLARDHAALLPLDHPAILLLVGGDVLGAASNDSWSLDEIELAAVAVSAPAVDRGLPVRFSVELVGGVGALTATWLGLPTGCAGSSSLALTCPTNATSPGDYPVRVRVVDSLGASVESPPGLLVVNPPPAVAVQAAPTSGAVPLNVSFEATATGGTGALVLLWAFGDGTNGTGGAPSHTYTTAGAFNATVEVTDADGVHAVGILSIDAFAKLTLRLSVDPSTTFWVGNASVIAATASGGVPPYSYAFSKLPDGCTMDGANASRCAIPTPGSYAIDVTVTDASHQAATASITLAAVAGSARTTGVSSPTLLDRFELPIAAAIGLSAIGLVALLAVRARRPPRRPPMTTVPVPEAHELPAPWSSGYVPPPARPGPGARRP